MIMFMGNMMINHQIWALPLNVQTNTYPGTFINKNLGLNKNMGCKTNHNWYILGISWDKGQLLRLTLEKIVVLPTSM
jgi:hypothetical protein